MKYTDSQDNEINPLIQTDMMQTEFKLTNNTENDKNIFACAVLFSGQDRILKAYSLELESLNGETVDFALPLDLSDYEAGQYLKLFIWKDGQQPVCQSIDVH